MRHARMVLVICLTAVSCGVTAGSAFAKTSPLVLTVPGFATAKVGEAFHFFVDTPRVSTSLGTIDCDPMLGESYFEGNVLSNIETTDRLELRKAVGSIGGSNQCESTLPQGKVAYPYITGVGVPLGELTITPKGKMALTFHEATLGIYFLESEETCIYPMKSTKGTVYYINEAHPLFFEVKAAKLKKRSDSALNCPKTATLELGGMVLKSSSNSSTDEWGAHTADAVQ